MTDVTAAGGRALLLLDRLLDALLDPRRRERVVVVLLAGYAAIWTLYGAVAKGSQDLHFDMGELVAWSREIALGSPKHPPLSAWLVGVWFSVFPLADWAYYLLAILTASLALWVAWKSSAPYLDGEKRVAGLALLTLVPFYNFHALKFNANTVMTPIWALTTWWFLRSYETRRPLYAVLAGLAAAAAMLSKYWSIFLLLGLGIAALLDPRRRRYFGSAAPWLTIAAGALAITPHVAWLYADGFKAFDYAVESHAATAFDALVSGLGYVLGSAGYVAVPTAIAVAAARPKPGAVADTVWPLEAQRRLVWWAFVLPLVLPIFGAVIVRAQMVSLWAIGSMTLFPVVLLSSAQVAITRLATRRILALALALPVVALALSPLIATVIHWRGLPNYSSQYRLVAQAADRTWAATTDRPLRLVGSYYNLLYGALFYFPGRPSTLDITDPSLTPWTDDARVAREGIVMFCPVAQAPCMKAMEARAARGPAGKRVEVEIARSYLGTTDAPVRYLIMTMPPAGAAAAQ